MDVGWVIIGVGGVHTGGKVRVLGGTTSIGDHTKVIDKIVVYYINFDPPPPPHCPPLFTSVCTVYCSHKSIIGHLL